MLKKVLNKDQIKSYRDKGFIIIKEFVKADWLTDLQNITNEMVLESRNVKKTNNKFVLESGHTFNNPRLLRLNMPQDQHEIYRNFAMEGPIVDVAEDLL